MWNLRIKESAGASHSTAAPATHLAPAPAQAPLSIRNPLFNVLAPPSRPIAYLGDHKALTKTVYGHKMVVDTRNDMGVCYLLDGYWEEWIVRHLKDFVRPGMRVADIGANMGFYTLLLCDLVGPQGHVFSFEPLQGNYDILVRNIELNNYKGRCTPVKKLVHAHSGVFPFNLSNGNGTVTVHSPPAASLAGDGFGKQLTVVELEGTSLDDYFGPDAPPLDVLKIDAEGCDPFVLQGMQGMLRQQAPVTILCEFCPPANQLVGADVQRFLDDVKASGLRISEFTAGGIVDVHSPDELLKKDWAELLLRR